MFIVFFFKQKTAYEMRISDWSSDVCSSDLLARQFLEFVTNIVAAKRGQAMQAEVEDRLHLNLGQAVGRAVVHLAIDRLDEADIGRDVAYRPFAREQRIAGRRRTGRYANDAADFVEIADRNDEAGQEVRAVAGLGALELAATGDDFFEEGDERDRKR